MYEVCTAQERPRQVIRYHTEAVLRHAQGGCERKQADVSWINNECKLNGGMVQGMLSSVQSKKPYQLFSGYFLFRACRIRSADISQSHELSQYLSSVKGLLTSAS